MKCNIIDVKQVYKLFDFISQFVEIVRIEASETGLKFICMSACHSVFLDVKLDLNYFDSYECPKNETIHVNLPVILSAIKNGSAKDSLSIITTDDTVDIEIIQETKTMKYTLRQIAQEDDSLEVPEIDEDVCINITPAFLKDWKSSVVDFTKAAVTLTPMKNSLVLESKDSMSGTVKLVQEIPSEGIEYLGFNDPQPVTLGNKNLSRAFSIGKVSDAITFGYKHNFPVRFGASLGGGSLQLYLAPCLSEDMDSD